MSEVPDMSFAGNVQSELGAYNVPTVKALTGDVDSRFNGEVSVQINQVVRGGDISSSSPLCPLSVTT